MNYERPEANTGNTGSNPPLFMALQLSPYLIPMLGSAVASLLTAGIGVFYRKHTGARSLSVLMLAVTWWSVTNMVAIATTDLGVTHFAYKLMYPAVAIVPVVWFVFAIQYTGRIRHPTRREVGALLVVPALTALLVWTNGYHGLFWSSTDLVSSGSLLAFSSIKGPGFWLHATYSYLLVGVGTALILQMVLLSDGVHRGQAVVLSLAALLPVGGNILFLTGFTGVFDATTLGFAFSGVILMAGIFRGQILQVVPVAKEIARDEIIDSMASAVIIVDAHGQVVDFNSAAKDIIDHPSSGLTGASLDTVLPGVAEVIDLDADESPERAEISLAIDGQQRTYDTRLKQLKRGFGTITGQMITLTDVTEEREREQRIEGQRERLEVINRVLRHDIRNNMTVILGNAEILLDAKQCESHARRIKRKGEDIVELSEKARKLEDLARGNYGEKRDIDIADLTNQIVMDIEQEYPDAEIKLDRPGGAEAYVSSMIDSAIRNVVENAVEHNDQSTPQVSVTVTQSTSESEDITIEVADNGSGLPDQEREVIETGTETALKHSLGLGLWLAKWVVTHSGGEISFSENSPQGTVLTIRLPSATSGTDTV